SGRGGGPLRYWQPRLDSQSKAGPGAGGQVGRKGGLMSSGTHSIDGSAAVRPVRSGPVHAAGIHVPQDVPPTVGIGPITATVVAGQPVSVTVTADQGTHWFIDTE